MRPGCVRCSLRVSTGWTRGEIDEAIADEAKIRPDHKQLRGLAKIALDGATFTTGTELSPPDLRERVFKEAARRGPLALGDNPFGRLSAAQLLAELAPEFGVTADQLREALYGDLKGEQRLEAVGIGDPARLIERYNVGVVQAVLLKASSVTVTLERPTAARLRQLMRYVKFHQLMHRVVREGETLTLTVDGPESVLKQTSRYGLKLATFLPAVLLQERWTLSAQVAWTRGPRELKVDATMGLVGHYADRGGHESREAGWFRDRWIKLDTGWELSDGQVPMNLGGRSLIMPDFTFRKDGRVAHLEIIGFWRKDYLERRLVWLADHGPGNLILAVSKRMLADKTAWEGVDTAVVPFGEIVPARKVLALVEEVARAE